jgi:hypothetical protein
VIIKPKNEMGHTTLPMVIYVRPETKAFDRQHGRIWVSFPFLFSIVLPHIDKAVESTRTNETCPLTYNKLSRIVKSVSECYANKATCELSHCLDRDVGFQFPLLHFWARTANYAGKSVSKDVKFVVWL